MKYVMISAMTLCCTFHPVQSAGLSSYDRQIVASCMVLEAGCDGAEGMQAVLNVIINRAEGYLHRMVPETVKRGSFSCMSSIWNSPFPNYSSLLCQAQNQPAAYSIALRLIETMENGQLWDNTYGATHYHTTDIRPYWVSDMHYLTTVGSHYFYTHNIPRQVSQNF
ncbi:cell wall hydrolase [Tichowtungia aerotolerans]|uniref:Cell wall hydrolase SleB domain-containing protein n=1 Tax=Tichowtungia aerotolerans TaxID=2697043 RepID=A0A6P1MES0_9BACT|nr:cell wall hydrolase [Tichowtungia aerotolerans]QHI70528.1 hypothetical protein GT409_14130 [Tichowtungia aerotolerans]